MPGTEEVPDVDHGTTASSRAPWAALPERPDRRQVDAGRALHPAGQARRPSAHGGRARGAERAPLHPRDRLPVARPGQGSATEEHGPRLSHALGLGRHAEAAAPRLVRPGPRAGGQGGEPDGGDHRQPERQGRGKRSHAGGWRLGLVGRGRHRTAWRRPMPTDHPATTPQADGRLEPGIADPPDDELLDWQDIKAVGAELARMYALWRSGRIGNRAAKTGMLLLAKLMDACERANGTRLFEIEAALAKVQAQVALQVQTPPDRPSRFLT